MSLSHPDQTSEYCASFDAIRREREGARVGPVTRRSRLEKRRDETRQDSLDLVSSRGFWSRDQIDETVSCLVSSRDLLSRSRLVSLPALNKVLFFEKKNPIFVGEAKNSELMGKIRFFLAKVRQAIIMFFRDGGFGFVRSEDEQFAGAEFENPEDDPRLPT